MRMTSQLKPDFLSLGLGGFPSSITTVRSRLNRLLKSSEHSGTKEAKPQFEKWPKLKPKHLVNGLTGCLKMDEAVANLGKIQGKVHKYCDCCLRGIAAVDYFARPTTASNLPLGLTTTLVASRIPNLLRSATSFHSSILVEDIFNTESSMFRRRPLCVQQ